jgi:hypothetical protein
MGNLDISRNRQQSDRKITYQPELGQTKEDVRNAFLGSQRTAGAEGAAYEGGAMGFLANPGYSAEEKSAIRNATEQAQNAGFASAEDKAKRVAAREGTSAMPAVQQAERAKAISGANTAQQFEMASAERTRQDKLAGLSMLGQKYGLDQSTMANLLGLEGKLSSLVREDYTSGAGTGGNYNLDFSSLAGGGV